MSDKIDPKHPIENWRFEVVVDEQDLLNLLKASGKFSVKRMLASLGRAVLNSEKFIENRDFCLTEDGSLILCRAHALLPNHILEIDLTEIDNTGPLARLERELVAREGGKEFFDWNVSGHLKGSASYTDRLMLDPKGMFYLLNRNNSWNAIKHLEANPLP